MRGRVSRGRVQVRDCGPNAPQPQPPGGWTSALTCRRGLAGIDGEVSPGRTARFTFSKKLHLELRGTLANGRRALYEQKEDYTSPRTKCYTSQCRRLSADGAVTLHHSVMNFYNARDYKTFVEDTKLKQCLFPISRQIINCTCFCKTLLSCPGR